MAGHQREIETLRRSMRELKRQIHGLQELLANREREHIKEMEKSKPLSDHQVSHAIAHFKINIPIPPPPPTHTPSHLAKIL